MDGKHYNRALRVHKIMLEAFQRLLLLKFESENSDCLGEEGKALLTRLAKEPSRDNLLLALQNDGCKKMMSLLTDFEGKVRKGEMGKTAQFWMLYMDRVWLMLQLQRATKENNLDLHLESLQQMCKLFFSYDHQNYSRYTALYLVSMLNLPTTHPGAEDLLRKNGFSVKRSEVPSCRTAVDITIELTINRHAKSYGGIVGFSTNKDAYFRWCVTRHARASYQQAALYMADMDAQDTDSHKDLRPSQIAYSEGNTLGAITAILNFINPFEVEDKDTLFCLSSGAPIPPDIAFDLLNANEAGENAYKAFIAERLVNKTKNFNAPIKRLNLKTFSNTVKSSKVKGKTKTRQITAERNVFGQLVLLAIEHNISLERVLCFPLGPVPWPLATADGCPVKTNKATLLHALEGDVPSAEKPDRSSNTYVIDGNALYQSQVSLPTTLGEFAESVFDQLPKEPRVDFVTDSYHTKSIKATERNRRGSSAAYLIQGPSTKVPRDWKAFLSNDKNKMNLTKFLLQEWKTNKFAPKLHGRTIMFVCEDTCTKLTSVDGLTTLSEQVLELCSDQEEADTKIILHCLHIGQNSPQDSCITVRSPDTDVFILLLRYADKVTQKILFDTGVSNKRRLVDIKTVAQNVGKEICSALPALHAFSGADATSAFVRKGKLAPLKILKQNPEYIKTFSQLGVTVNIESSVLRELEEFTCLLYRGRGSRTSDVNKLRFEKFQERFNTNTELLTCYNGIDMSLLPPCRDALHMHIERVNYQTLIWNKSDVPKPGIPLPPGHGWKKTPDGLEVEWTRGLLMPGELVDVVVEDPSALGDEPEPEPEPYSFIDHIFDDDDDDV